MTKHLSKALAVVAMLLFHAVAAQASAKLSLSDVKVVGDGTYTVEVFMDNDVPVASVNGIMSLPQGVTYVTNSFVRADRVPTGESFSFSFTYDTNSNAFSLVNFTSNDMIEAGSGLIFSFKVNVSGLTEAADIVMSDLSLSTRSGNIYTNANTETTATAKVTPVDCQLTVNPATIEITQQGEATVGMMLACPEGSTGAQVDVTLPEGMTIVSATKGSMLANTDHTVSVKASDDNEQLYTVMVFSATNSAFQTASGELFKLTVKATEVLEYQSVVFSNIRASALTGKEAKAEAVEVPVIMTDLDYKLTSSPETVEVTGEDGEATVSLQLNCPGERVGAYMSITLPEGLEYVSSTAALGEMKNDHILNFKKDENGNSYSVMVLSTNNLPFTATTGELLSFKVKANGTIAEGAKITVSDIRLPHVSGKEVKPEALEIAVVQKPAYTLGDVNGDGNIDTVDATYILRYLVGNTPDDFIEEAADYDQDDEISTKDATAILKKLVE